MPIISPKITAAGLALPLGTALTHIGLGTSIYDPVGNETALKAEKVRFPITTGSASVPRAVQIGALITNTDPNGRTINGQPVGEIGIFAGTTLFAVWSRASGVLFRKDADFSVALAYTIDVSVLPDNAVTVNVNADLIGMASMILDHQSVADPHAQYALKTQVQAGSLIYALDTGGANAYRATYSPALSALSDGSVLRFQAITANTGACTFSPNGLPAKPLLGASHQPLQGGEIAANGKCAVQWHAALNSWLLVESTGGAMQVGAATQSNHALPLAQAQSMQKTITPLLICLGA